MTPLQDDSDESSCLLQEDTHTHNAEPTPTSPEPDNNTQTNTEMDFSEKPSPQTTHIGSTSADESDIKQLVSNPDYTPLNLSVLDSQGRRSIAHLHHQTNTLTPRTALPGPPYTDPNLRLLALRHDTLQSIFLFEAIRPSFLRSTIQILARPVFYLCVGVNCTIYAYQDLKAASQRRAARQERLGTPEKPYAPPQDNEKTPGQKADLYPGAVPLHKSMLDPHGRRSYAYFDKQSQREVSWTEMCERELEAKGGDDGVLAPVFGRFFRGVDVLMVLELCEGVREGWWRGVVRVAVWPVLVVGWVGLVGVCGWEMVWAFRRKAKVEREREGEGRVGGKGGGDGGVGGKDE